MVTKSRKSKSFQILEKPFLNACKARIGEMRQTGSLGHGTMKHANIRSMMLPLVSKINAMPRYTCCVQLVAAVDAKYSICNTPKQQETWVATEAAKLHKWFAGAGSFTLIFSAPFLKV